MKSFIKENVSLVIALALPLAFAAFFFISKSTVHQNVAPPEHDFVLANTSRNGFYNFSVINNSLRVQFKYPILHENRAVRVNQPEVYYVDAKTMIAEPIIIDIPNDASSPAPDLQGQYVTLDIEKFAKKSFSGAKISPDGFELANRRHRDGNLMTEIFSTHRGSDRDLILTKDGARFDIRGLDRHYGLKVVAWRKHNDE